MSLIYQEMQAARLSFLPSSRRSTGRISSRGPSWPHRPTGSRPYGPHFYAGMNTSAQSWGPGHGVSRVPRLKNGRKAAGIPMAVGGRSSHAPQPNADYTEKVNKKERRKAIRSAIAATASQDWSLPGGTGSPGSCRSSPRRAGIPEQDLRRHQIPGGRRPLG